MTETYYEVLGVEPDASSDEIGEAYRRQVHEWHPDVSGEPDARERFMLIKEAKEVLLDEKKRQRYDRVGHDAYTGNGSSDAGRGNGRTDETDDSGGRRRQTDETDESTDGEQGGSGGRTRRDQGERSQRERGRSQRNGGGGRRERSAADEYRRRQRTKRSRSRADDTGGRTRGESTGASGGQQTYARQQGDSRADAERTDEGADDDGGSARRERRRSSRQPERGFGQPAGSGIPVGSDAELLKYPFMLFVFYSLGPTVSGPLSALLLLPVYLQYRRMKFTDRIIREGSMTRGFETMRRRLVASMVITLGSVGLLLGLAVVDMLDTMHPSRLAPIFLALFGGSFVTLRYFKELLLRDWFNAEGTSQPVAWDVLSRWPVLILPLLWEVNWFGSLTDDVFMLCLFAPGLVPVAYFVRTGQHRELEFVDALLN